MTRRLILVSTTITLLFTSAVATAQIDNYIPVTDAMLQHPDPADWLNWRRTLDGQAHSPLNQITTDNVGDLRLVWS